MTEAPFFIMGSRRSGTTLVSQILNRHSRLAVYHESFFYPIFRPELRWYGNLADPGCLEHLIADVRAILSMQGTDAPAASAIKAAMAKPTFESLVAALLALYARGRGKVRGGDKTPDHYEFLDEIQNTIPEGPVVFLMRDPRDTALSIHRTFGMSLGAGARSWNAAFLALRRARRPVHVVRYEALVKSPADQVRAMCDFLGEDYEESMLTFFQSVPEKWKSHRGREKLGTPVDASSVGAWRSLPARDVSLIESLCGEGMDAMGYPFAAGRPKTVQSLRTVVSRRSSPIHLLEQLRYYGVNVERWRRGMARWRLMLRVRARYFVYVLRRRRSSNR